MGRTQFLSLSTKGRHSLGFWWATIGLAALGYAVGQMPMLAVQYYQIKNNVDITPEVLDTFSETMNFELLHLDSNFGFLLMISIFIFGSIGIVFGLRLQLKTLKDIITPRSVDYRKILFGLVLWFGLTLLFEALHFAFFSEHYSFQFSLSKFVPLLFIALFLLPIQTSFEEFIFRGHLLQGLSLWAKRPYIAVIISTILFSLMHSMNPEIEKYGFWSMQVYYMSAGILLCVITLWDDGLELALGVHAAVNIYGATMVTYDGAVIQTPTIARSIDINLWVHNAVFIVCSLIFLLVCYKKYGWSTPKDFWSLLVSEYPFTKSKPIIQDVIDANLKATTKTASDTDYTSFFNDKT